jgi:hypothetical protein
MRFFTDQPNQNKASGPLEDFINLIHHCRRQSFIVAMTDAPDTRKRNNEDLEKQAMVRRIKKEELIKEKGLERATEEYIDALY